MLKKLIVAVSILMMSLSNVSWAGSVNNATITNVAILQQFGDLLFVQTNQAINNPPTSCSNSTGFQFVVSLSNAMGQHVMAILLAARAAQNPVYIAGSGACDLFSNVETLVSVTY
jgi:hypothetical protein